MANILDYLDWRGDIPVELDGFNEVDNLILAKLSFIDFSGIVPPPGAEGNVRLGDASAEYFARNGDAADDMGVLVPDEVPELLRRMAASARFRDARLSAYEEVLDEEREEQFAALCIELSDGTTYCAFRGTDDTLVGWKEDLNLGFLEAIPSQTQSLDYLIHIAKRYGALRIGGHSKGGNLAVYSAAHAPAEVQERILAVYNNDGPGFKDDLTGTEGYRRIAARIRTYKPQSSVVGQLLEHTQDVTVVHSTGVSIGQHNGFTWEVRGPAFIHRPELSREGKLAGEALGSTTAELSMEQRRAFVEALYEILTGTGARTLSELNEEKLKNAAGMLKTYRDLDEPTREALSDAIRILLKHGAKSIVQDVRSSQEKGVDELRRKVEEFLRKIHGREP